MQSIVENLARELELVKQNERKLVVRTTVSETVDKFIQSTSEQLKGSLITMLNKHILTTHPKDESSHANLWDKSVIQCNLPYANTYRNTFGYKIRDEKLREAKTDTERLCTNIEYDIKTYVNEQVDSWIDSVNGKIADYIRSTISSDIEQFVTTILKRETIMERFTERRMSEILDCSFDNVANRIVLTELIRTALSESFSIDDNIDMIEDIPTEPHPTEDLHDKNLSEHIDDTEDVPTETMVQENTDSQQLSDAEQL